MTSRTAESHQHSLQATLLKSLEPLEMNKIVGEIAWQAALEVRTCPPAPLLLEKKASHHLMTCERCRARVRDEELVPPVYDRIGIPVQPAPHTRPQRGEVWRLRSAHEGWKDDGRYVASASVFVVHFAGILCEVALVYEDPFFASDGDFELPYPHLGFVEAWNTFTVHTKELETRWMNRDEALLRGVNAWRLLYQRGSVHDGVMVTVPHLEEFRALESDVSCDLATDAIDSRPSDEILLKRLIDETDWEDLTHRLLLYAARRLRFCQWRDKTSVKLPADYVQEAVMLVLEGRRHLPRDRDAPFFAFLCGVIDSLVSHHHQSAWKRRSVSFSLDEHDLLVECMEEEFAVRDRFNAFLAQLPTDLARYAALRMSDEERTAEEYAQQMGTTVSEVRNLDRRLYRRRRIWENIA